MRSTILAVTEISGNAEDGQVEYCTFFKVSTDNPELIFSEDLFNRVSKDDDDEDYDEFVKRKLEEIGYIVEDFPDVRVCWVEIDD